MSFLGTLLHRVQVGRASTKRVTHLWDTEPIQGLGSEIRKTSLPHLLRGQPWLTDVTSLNLSFLIYEMGREETTHFPPSCLSLSLSPLSSTSQSLIRKLQFILWQRLRFSFS